MENDDSYVKNKKDETDEKEAEQQTASTVSSPFKFTEEAKKQLETIVPSCFIFIRLISGIKSKRFDEVLLILIILSYMGFKDTFDFIFKKKLSK